MPTLKQKNLAKTVLENPELYKKGRKAELVELGGYGKTVQKTPSKALESKGFIEELDKLGLTDELLTTSLVEDIINKPKNRKGELELGFKVRGRLSDKQEGDSYIFNILNVNQIKRIARRIQDGNSESETVSD